LPGIESTGFSVLRIKRDVLSRSRVGLMLTDRSRSAVSDGSNQLFGVDGQFNFMDDFEVSAYAAKTDTDGLQDNDSSYMVNFDYSADRYGARAGYLVVEDNFNPEIGFKRRNNFEQLEGGLRFSPRIASSGSVRRLVFEADTESYWSADLDELETREHALSFTTEFEQGDELSVSVSDRFEAIANPFQIARGVILQPGKYDFTGYEASYRLGTQRRFSGTFQVETGDFWSGTIKSIGFNGGRIELSPQLSLEPGYSFNKVELPEGDFETELGLLRVTYTISPRMYFSGLAQYESNSSSFSTNFRFRWEYAPSSELFVVYSDDRDTSPFGDPRSFELRNRGWAVKITRLFQI
ncbi:MAG: hypothetical protein RL120_03430, partial [Gammaproteobacteria bacterium]